MVLERGTRLGRYEILGPLGAGGMGEIYRARDAELEREVAVKILPKELASDHERLERFKKEAKALAKLSHPNLLEIFDFGSEGGVTFAVTELLEGQTLRHRMAGGAMEWQEVLGIGSAIADGLAAAHVRGVVHRDLKPENVFLTSDERVKILDFGLARLVRPVSPEAETEDLGSPGTEAGRVMGTVGYMSPEQVRGVPADHRADIFSLGCVLFEMLSGRRAFSRPTPVETLTAILREQPAESSGLETTPGLERIVMRCLEKKPQKRFQSALDLAFALRELTRLPGARAGATPSRPEAPPDRRPSIAVLPFANLSSDPEQAYFCDGMAEELINALTHVEALRVVARTSSFMFKGRHEDVREIGSKLDVETVLEGSVRKAGDRLRITVQLIDVVNGYHLWSERYDRQLQDVFAIQDEIAMAIVEKLKVRLLGRETTAMVRRYTENLDAYNAYLKGLHHWSKLTPEGFQRSIECHREAIRIDPAFAPAYVQLGVWYLSQAFWASIPPLEGLPKAMTFAEKALAIDETISDAHNLVGCVLAFFERDWVAGERRLRRAVELGPNVAMNHTNYAALLINKKRYDEAIREVRLAQRLDPLGPTTNAWAGAWLAYAGQYEDGVAELKKAITMDPNHWLPHYELSDVYARGAKLEEAQAEAEKAVELSAGVSISVAQLACICYRLGRTGRAEELFEELEERSRKTYVAPTFFAWIHLARGEADEALSWIHKAVDAQDPWLAFHRQVSLAFGPSDPRIDSLLEKLGL